MRVHYSGRKEDVWKKGHLHSRRGNRDARFLSDENEEVIVYDAEYGFYDSGFSVTGYVKSGDGYRLESFDVRVRKP